MILGIQNAERKNEFKNPEARAEEKKWTGPFFSVLLFFQFSRFLKISAPSSLSRDRRIRGTINC